jgi:transcriptional regulator with XRE-family HTH domain
VKMIDWRARLRLAVALSGKKHSIIAEDAGITPATLSRILTGVHSKPQFETVVRIAHAAGEHVGWILLEPRRGLSSGEAAMLRNVAAFLVERFRLDV